MLKCLSDNFQARQFDSRILLHGAGGGAHPGCCVIIGISTEAVACPDWLLVWRALETERLANQSRRYKAYSGRSSDRCPDVPPHPPTLRNDVYLHEFNSLSVAIKLLTVTLSPPLPNKLPFIYLTTESKRIGRI